MFLSGLQKLIVPVPADFLDDDYYNYVVEDDPLKKKTKKNIVRLYRGMPVDDTLSNSLWLNPKVWAKKEDATGNFLPNQVEEDNEVTYYTSLGFSSYSTDIRVSCEFAYRNSNNVRPPNMIVYEPRGGEINLPSLQIISDIVSENEYLMFPQSPKSFV